MDKMPRHYPWELAQMQSLDRMENAEIRRKLASAVVAFCQQMISAAESRR